MKLPKSELLLCLVALSAASTQTTARSATSCGLLLGKIYCFGGFLYTSPTESRPDNIINVLDLTKNSGATATNLQGQWKTVSSTPKGVNLLIRTYPQSVALPDGKRLLINGGLTDSSVPLKDQNIVYNAETNAWENYESYSEPPYGKRQIYYGTAVNVPGRGVAFFGGFEQHINLTWKVPSSNISTFNFDNNKSRAVGYTQIAFFDINNAQKPWSAPLPPSVMILRFSSRLTSVYDPVNHMLIYLGGEYRSNAPSAPSIDHVGRLYNSALTFNLLTNKWDKFDLGGAVPFSGRVFATLTLLPNTQRDLVLYGGEVNGIAVLDYCFTLNLDTRTWRRQTIDAPAGTTLSRTEHSAVLVDNNTLFIMWGIDGNRAGVGSILILNVSNPNAITLLDKYIDPNSPNTWSGQSSLGNGSKIGIAVGCVVAGLVIIAGIIWWCCIRKKRRERHEELLAREVRQRQNENTQQIEPMEVDWDKIEEKFMEIPKSNIGTTAYHSSNAMASTSARSPTLVNSTEGQSAITPSIQSLDNRRTIPPDIGDSSEQFNVIKPDGGY